MLFWVSLEGGGGKTGVVGMGTHSYGCLRQKMETLQGGVLQPRKEMSQTASTLSLNIGILYLDENLILAWVSPVQPRQECSSAAANCNMLMAGVEMFYIWLRPEQEYAKIQADAMHI